MNNDPYWHDGGVSLRDFYGTGGIGRTCSHCSYPYDPSSKICPGCGSWYEEQMGGWVTRTFNVGVDVDRVFNIAEFDKAVRRISS